MFGDLGVKVKTFFKNWMWRRGWVKRSLYEEATLRANSLFDRLLALNNRLRDMDLRYQAIYNKSETMREELAFSAMRDALRRVQDLDKSNGGQNHE